MPEERICKSIKKSLDFSGSGETFSIEVHIENISPQTSKEMINSILDALFDDVKRIIY